MSNWQERYFFVPAVELNGALRAGRFSAVDMIRAFIRRLETEGARSRLIQAPLADGAIRAARATDKELKRGRTRGILQGLPFAVSDLLSTAPGPTAWGTASLAGQVLAEEAAAVTRLRKATAIPVAKLRTEPLGGVANGFQAIETAAGAALARGLAAFALSVDFNGNVLRAAWSAGCFALRPTFGRVSGFGVAPLAWTLATPAVAARTAEDCGHILAAMSGPDIRSSWSAGKTFRYAPEYATPVRQMRLAAAGAARRTLASASGRLGVSVSAAGDPPFPCAGITEVILAAEAGAALDDLLPEQPRGQELLKAASELRALDYLHAMRLRGAVQAWLAQFFAGADVLMLDVGGRGLAAGAADQAGFEASPEPTVGAWLCAALLGGLPMLALPPEPRSSFPPVLLCGRPDSENTLLRLAAALAP